MMDYLWFVLLPIVSVILSSPVPRTDVLNYLHGPKQVLYGKAGSNFTMPGLEQDQHSGVIEWEFSRSMEVPLTYISIVTHYFGDHGSPDVFSAYTKRILFLKSNGSFILHQLKKSDAGIYHMKINLAKSRYIVLKVQEPVSNVSIFWVPAENSSFLLYCNFSGDADSILWRMDGKGIPAGYKLMSRNCSLQVPSTAACAIFHCEVFSVFGKQLSNANHDRDDKLCKDQTSTVIAVTSTVTILIVIILLIICCYYQRKKRQNTTSY